MPRFVLIKDWPSKKLICHFCKTDKSVKYALNLSGGVVPCCNKCLLKYASIAPPIMKED